MDFNGLLSEGKELIEIYRNGEHELREEYGDFMEDPEVQEVVEKFRSEPDDENKADVFAKLMIEEDYRSAVKLVDSAADMLDARYTREAATLRKKRNEYGLPEPSKSENSSERLRRGLEAVNDVYDLAAGNSDDIYLDEFMPALDKALNSEE